MKGRRVIRLLFFPIACLLVLSACCSFPYRVGTRQTAKSERVEVHPLNAEIVYVDGKMVSMSKFLWLIRQHLVINKGDHDMKVNYWEKTVISKSPKKIHFTAKPGDRYCVECTRVRADKTAKKKGNYLTKRRGGENLKDDAGYLYTFECCLKDKATGKKISCK